MKLGPTYSFHGGKEEWKARHCYDWICSMFDAPAVRIGTAASKDIRDHVRGLLSTAGWALDFPVESPYSLNVTAKRRDLAFQIQTGNASRAAYDLVKLQHLYLARQIQAACLALPSPQAAVAMGSNLANSKRFSEEINLFSRQITVPLILVAFE